MARLESGTCARPRLRKRGLLTVVLALLVAGAPSVALAAYASSDKVYRQTLSVAGYGSIRACLLAAVDVFDSSSNPANMGTTYSFDTSGALCDGGKSLPAGWIGVTLDGYRNGAFCGTTYYQWSSITTSFRNASAQLCTNPSGSQSFYTNVFGRIYSGSGFNYNIPGISSPGQSG